MRRDLTMRALLAATAAACSSADSTGPGPTPEPVPAAVSLATQPSSTAKSGVPLAAQPVVRLRTSTGAVAPKAGVVVSAAVIGGSLTVTNATATTDASGSAAFTGLTLTGTVGSYTLRFTAPDLTPADAAAPTVLAAGPPAKIVIAAQPPAAAASGAALVPPAAVQLQDQSGNPSPQSGVTVGAVVESGSVGLTNAAATTDASGLATFTGLTLSGTVGAYLLRFTAGNLAPVDAATAVALGPGPATQLAVTTQPAASATNGAPLPTQPAVQLRDAWGNAVPQAGVVVTAGLLSGTVTVSGATATTDATGAATFSAVTLTGAVGSYTLRFAATGFPAVLAAAPTQLLPGAAARLGVSTQPSVTAQSGVPLAQQPVVQVRDSSDNAVARSGVVVTVTAAVMSGGPVTVSSQTATTDSTGAARFSGLTLTGTIGSFRLRFNATGLDSADATQPTGLTAGAAVQLALTQQPAVTAQNTQSLSRQPLARLQDAQGNPVLQAGVVVTASLVSGSATLSNATATTSPQGIATFNGLTITGVIGSYILRFSAPNVGSVDASAATMLSAGPAAQLSLTTQPSAAAQSGVALAVQPVVQLRDVSGNTVAQGGVTVTASEASGTASLAGATATTVASGAATFNGLAISALAGGYTLRFTAPGLTGVDAASPTVVSAGAASQLTLATEPSTAAQSGIALATQPVARVRDAAGNPVPGVVVAADVVSGTVSVVNANATSDTAGLAAFAGLTLSGAAGSYTLRFRAAALAVTAAAPTDLGAGPAATLTLVTQPPAAAQSGVTFAPVPVVEVRDASSNLVSGVTVTAGLASGAGATLSNAVAVSDAGGLATFTGLTLTGAAGSFTLRFAVGLVTVDAAAATALTAGPAAQLTVVVQPPATAQSGVPFPTAPVVEVIDASQNPVSGLTVTAGLVTGSLTITSGAKTTGANGRATFTGLTLSGPVGAYTLRFTGGGLGDTASAATNLTPGPVATVTLLTPPPAAAQSGVVLFEQPVVQVEDAAGNAHVGVTVTATTGFGASLSNATAVTNGTGIATFSTLTLAGTVGSYNLVFTAGGRFAVAPTPTVLSAGAPAQIAVTTQPSAAAQSGIALASQPAVRVRDASNNPVAGVVVTASVASGTVALANAAATTNGSGIASFAGLTLSGAVGSYTLRFSGASLVANAAAPTVLSAGVPGSLVFATAPEDSAEDGIALPVQPVLRVQDGAGNAVAGVVVSGSIVDSGSIAQPRASLASASGTSVTTDGAGLASFAGLAISGTSNLNYTLKFTAGSLARDTTILLKVGPANTLTISRQPPDSAQTGVAFASGTEPIVVVRNAANTTLQGLTVTATATGATVTSGTAVTDANGEATFTGLTLTATAAPTGTGYTLAFHVGELAPQQAAVTQLYPGPATKLEVTTQPSTAAQSGVALGTQPMVRITDAGGNVSATQNRTVTAGLVSGSLALASATAVTDVNGVATFSGLTLSGLVGTYTLRFTEPGLIGVNAAAATVLSPGPPAKLGLATQPWDAAILGRALSQQPALQVEDAAGNAVAGAGVAVTASTVGPGPTLAGTSASTDAGGSAAFTALAVTTPAGNHRFRFTAQGLTSADAADSTIAATPIASGVPMTGLVSTVPDQQKHFGIVVPPGATELRVEISGGSGSFDDPDLYVRRARVPNLFNLNTLDCGNSNEHAGVSEICILPNPQPGEWYITLFTFFTYSNVTLSATVVTP